MFGSAHIMLWATFTVSMLIVSMLAFPDVWLGVIAKTLRDVRSWHIHWIGAVIANELLDEDRIDVEEMGADLAGFDETADLDFEYLAEELGRARAEETLGPPPKISEMF